MRQCSIIACSAAQAGYQKLYHYQSSKEDYLKDALQGRFHFSNPQHFNDPWDCSPSFDTLRVEDPAYRAACIDFYGRLYDPNGTKPDWAALKAELETDPAQLVNMIENIANEVRNVIAEHFRIYCFTPHCDSLLMWSHYSDKHRGICLEFDAGNPAIGGAYQVMYKDKLPTPDHAVVDREVLQILLSKSSVWRHEDEYRIVAHEGEVHAVSPHFIPITNKCYLSLPPSVLTAVIAGSRAEFDAIRAFVGRYAPTLQVKRAVRDEGQYALSVRG